MLSNDILFGMVALNSLKGLDMIVIVKNDFLKYYILFLHAFIVGEN